MLKVSINCWDRLCGDFMGGKDYFESEDEAREVFRKAVIDYLEDDVEIYLVNCDNNNIISEFRTFLRD